MARKPMTLRKSIKPGTWRWVGKRVSGLAPYDIPIGAKTITDIVEHLNGNAFRIGRVDPRNAVVVEKPPVRLLYVRPSYSRYRQTAQKVFPQIDWAVDYDHALARNIALNLGINYVLLIRISPRANRSHARYERAETIALPSDARLLFADRRIMDKWIGRSVRLMRDVERVRPYRQPGGESVGLTLKQRATWAFAIGVEDFSVPNPRLFRLF